MPTNRDAAEKNAVFDSKKMVSPSIKPFFLPYTCLMGQLSKILMTVLLKMDGSVIIPYPVLYCIGLISDY